MAIQMFSLVRHLASTLVTRLRSESLGPALGQIFRLLRTLGLPLGASWTSLVRAMRTYESALEAVPEAASDLRADLPPAIRRWLDHTLALRIEALRPSPQYYMVNRAGWRTEFDSLAHARWFQREMRDHRMWRHHLRIRSTDEERVDGICHRCGSIVAFGGGPAYQACCCSKCWTAVLLGKGLRATPVPATGWRT